MSRTDFEEPETLMTVSSGKKSENAASTEQLVFKIEDNFEVGGSDFDAKFVALTVRDIMLEYGFVSRSDPESPKTIDSIYYTLPRILDHGSGEKVTLRFQILNNFCIVYGSLFQKGKGDIYRLCIDIKNAFPGFEVSNFLKEVIDSLLHPLSTDLCERVGVVPPPSFMSMPTEIKLKILDLIDGTDLAKVACVCSELQGLSSDNDSSLWKEKFRKKFGASREPEVIQCSWKNAFMRQWMDLISIKQQEVSCSFIDCRIHFGWNLDENHEMKIRRYNVPFSVRGFA